MSSLTERLAEARQRTWHQAKELLETAEREQRELTAEERQSFSAMEADLDDKAAQLDRLRKEEERAATVIPAARVAPQPETGFDAEVRSMLKGEKRALVVGTAASGGNTLAATFVKNLYEIAQVNSGVLSAGPTILETSSGEQLIFPKNTSTQSVASLYSENTAITASDPTFGQNNLYAYKYGFLMYVSRELVEDTQVDLLGYLARQAGTAIGNAVGASYVTGAGHGSGAPNGVATATVGSDLGVTTATTGVGGAFTADELIDLFYSVIAPYRQNGTWLMKDATVAAVRKLKGVDDQYLWTPGFSGAPDTILGRPVVTDPYVASVATGAKSVLFGDFSQYHVRRAGGVRFESSNEFKFDYDLVTYKVTVRTDGLLFDTAAVKHLKGNAA